MPNRAHPRNRRRRDRSGDILGRAAAAACRMLFSRDIRCGVLATLLAFCIPASFAQTIAPPASTSAGEGNAAMPDQTNAEKAFARLRQWIDAFDSPRMDDAASRFALPNATGVCVVLRRSGRVLGIGSDTAGDDLMLRRAAGKAMNEVLGDPALASLSAQIRQQAGEADAAKTLESIHADLGRSLSIELEVSGKLSPLVGKSLDQLARKIDPGIDGIALRNKQSIEFTFPAQLRATNTAGDPGKLLLSLALNAGVAIKDIGELGAREDFGLYSFRTIALWQPRPDQQPLRTTRGDVIVPIESVNRQSIALFADGIAQHMMATRWPELPAADPNQSAPQREPLGIMGDYSPVADQFRPLVAGPLEQALAAFALARYANAADAGVNAESCAKAAKAAESILHDLALVAPAEADPRNDLAACAAIIYAVIESPTARQDAPIQQLFDAAAKRIHESFDAASGFVDRTATDGRARGVSPHAQALIAGAMARLLAASQTPPPNEDAAPVRKAIDAAWQSVAQPQSIALLPWIGWAEMDFAAATRKPIGHRDDLRLMLELLNDCRTAAATVASSQAAPDVVGGFALLSEGGLNASPQATSQSTRPAAWLSSALRHAELASPAKAAEAVRNHLLTMRFLMQLSVRPAHAGLYRNFSRALGGLRSAPWNSDQPVPAQALGLIAAVDALRLLPEHP